MKKRKKPIYKRLWFIMLCIFVILMAIGSMGSSEETGDSSSASENSVIEDVFSEPNPTSESEPESHVPESSADKPESSMSESPVESSSSSAAASTKASSSSTAQSKSAVVSTQSNSASPHSTEKTEQTEQVQKTEQAEKKKSISSSTTVDQASTTGNAAAAYWTPNGKSYHFSSNCTSLKRSKNILSGTLQEALNAGKKDPCNLCAGG